MGKRKILLIDDNQVNLKILEVKIRALDVDVCGIYDADRALEKLKNEKFDLVLLDYIMPSKSGLKVLEEIRLKYNSVELPVIMIIAEHDCDNIITLLEKGANDYVLKPFDFKLGNARISLHLSIKQLNEKIERQQIEKLKASSMAVILEMAGSIAHEIVNPLTIAVGTCELLDSQIETIDILPLALKDNLRKNIQKVSKSIEKAEVVISGLKALSRDESNIKQSSVNVRETIFLVLNFYRTTITSAGIDILGDQELDQNLEVLGKRGVLMQVLYNLFKNALYVLQNKEGKNFIEIKTKVEEKDLIISVSDSGGGILKNVAASIFDPYFSTKKTVSAGMGLTLSRELVQSIGGDLKYTGTDCQTEFSVFLKKA